MVTDQLAVASHLHANWSYAAAYTQAIRAILIW